MLHMPTPPSTCRRFCLLLLLLAALLPACTRSTAPTDPEYVDAVELKLKCRELADQMLATMPNDALKGVVALPTSFVEQGNRSVSSPLGRLISEALIYEFNQRGGGYTYGVTENPGTQGANIRKYVVGTNADNGVSYKQSSGINTHMLRLAEVYLNLADAILGNNASTTDATALEYFNKVRTRAGLEPKASISYEDLRHERRVEFAFEGLYWYDLLRRSYYQQQEVVNYLNSQNRNASYYQ